MTLFEELMNLNQARVILANKRAALPQGWADRGSALDRAREILQHAQEYLYEQAIEVGNTLNS